MLKEFHLGPVVQSVVSLTSLLRVISLTVLADSIYNILIFFVEKMHCKSYSHFCSKKFQHICVLLDVNFNESLTNDIFSFEQLGPDVLVEVLISGRYELLNVLCSPPPSPASTLYFRIYFVGNPKVGNLTYL